MTIEGTPETETETGKPRRIRAPRGGNPLVAEITENLEAPEDRIVREARALVPVESPAPTSTVVVEPEPGPSEEDQREPYNPFTRMQPNPPRPPAAVRRDDSLADRTKVNQTTPSTKRFGALGKKLPGAERAKVHKRVEGGNLAYIGEYTDGDMAQSQDIESFLHRYIKPMYGPGEYQITGVDAHGREFDMGIVNLLAPMAPVVEGTPQDTPLGLIKQLVDNAIRAPQQQRDPIKMLGELHELKSKMDPPAPPSGPKDNTLLLAIVGGLTTVAASLVSVLAAPKKEDPLMQLLMSKLLDDKPRGGGGPMPVMPPPVDPTEQLKNLAAVVQSLRGPESPKTNDDRLIEFLMKERMSPTDVLGLVNSVKSERGTDGLKKSMEDIGIMLNAVQQLRAHTEPGTGAGFWDAIGALVSNKELAGTVMDTIRNRRGGPQQLPPGQPVQVNDPLLARARDVAARRLALEEAEVTRREQALPTGAAPTPQLVTPPPQPQQPRPQAQPATLPKELPPDVGDFINGYIEAKDDAETVGNTIEMLFAFGKNETWKTYAEVIFNFIANSDRARFLNYMASLFVHLRSIGIIEDALARKVMEALSANFAEIVEAVKKQMEADAAGEGEGAEEDEEGEEEEEEDLLQLGNEEPLPEPG